MLYAAVTVGTTTVLNQASSSIIPLNAWTFVAATYSWIPGVSLTSAIYINGALDDAGTADTTLSPTTLARGCGYVAASCYSTDLPFLGRLAEMAIYGYALSPVQVAAHFAAGSSPAPPPPPAPPSPLNGTALGPCGLGAPYRAVILADSPWAWWRLAETSGTVAYDCSLTGCGELGDPGGRRGFSPHPPLPAAPFPEFL